MSTSAPPTRVVDSAVVDTLARLQQLATTLGATDALDALPQIVVLGSQSAGKSSTIESLVGLSFLPRGTGIVTRCPLLLHLRPRDTGPADYGVFGHGGGAPVADMEEVRQEIEARTAALAGGEKDICPTPIVLRLHVAGAPSLTLVDLPGVTRVPVRGQPEDIGEKIKRLCQSFARNPRAVLLCVSAANADLATSEALVLAREVDRAGDRTIGVLTKTDLMDPGTDCAAVLRNEVFPLRLGYVAVVCRGQRDLDENGTVSAAHQREGSFFLNHAVYGAPRHRDLLEACCGIGVLAQKLSALLVAATREAAPHLRSACRQRLDAVEARAHQLGEEEQSGDPARVVLEAVLLYAKTYATLAREGAVGDARWLCSQRDDELRGAARLAHVFERVFAASLAKADPLDGISDDDVRACLLATSGASPALFAPEKAFYALVRQQIQRLRDPGLECVDLVCRELENCASHVAEPTIGEDVAGAVPAPLARLRRAPKLRGAVREAVVEIVRKEKDGAKERVADLVACELQHINTRHPDFVAALSDVTVRLGCLSAPSADFSDDDDDRVIEEEDEDEEEPEPERQGWFGGLRGATPPRQRNRRESFVLKDQLRPRRHQRPRKVRADPSHVDVVKALVRAYFAVVRKTFCDLVPKIVMTHVVHKVEEQMQATLVGRVAGAEHANLLEEDTVTAQERRETRRARDGLRDALRLLDDVQHAQTPLRKQRADSLEGDRTPPLSDRQNAVTTRRRDRSPGPVGFLPSPEKTPRKGLAGLVAARKENFMRGRR
jgi:dynamin 1-like protein